MTDSNQHQEHEYEYALTSWDLFLTLVGGGVFVFLICAGIALMVWAGVGA